MKWMEMKYIDANDCKQSVHFNILLNNIRFLLDFDIRDPQILYLKDLYSSINPRDKECINIGEEMSDFVFRIKNHGYNQIVKELNKIYKETPLATH
jgi:hypothetical protein